MQFDPFYWILRLVLRGFLRADLKIEERSFIEDNIQKHRGVLRINLAATILVYIGLRHTEAQAIGTVVASLLAPVMVLGGAWFAITFGGVPLKLIEVAMSTTRWMFIAFSVSLSAMFISVAFITSFYIWPALILVYIGTMVSCIQYDTADGLKAGLDEALFKHSRAAITYYKKQGIDPDKELVEIKTNPEGRKR